MRRGVHAGLALLVAGTLVWLCRTAFRSPADMQVPIAEPCPERHPSGSAAPSPRRRAPLALASSAPAPPQPARADSAIASEPREVPVCGEVVARFHEVLEREIRAKAGELDDGIRTGEAGFAPKGSLRAAREGSARLQRDLPSLVAEELGWAVTDVSRLWENRRDAVIKTSSYGTGSFAVIRHEAAASNSPEGTRPDLAGDEEWWRTATLEERTGFLIAHFVESSGIFDVVRVLELCATCRPDLPTPAEGRGDGGCPRCGDSERVRLVTYR